MKRDFYKLFHLTVNKSESIMASAKIYNPTTGELLAEVAKATKKKR